MPRTSADDEEEKGVDDPPRNGFALVLLDGLDAVDLADLGLERGVAFPQVDVRAGLQESGAAHRARRATVSSTERWSARGRLYDKCNVSLLTMSAGPSHEARRRRTASNPRNLEATRLVLISTRFLSALSSCPRFLSYVDMLHVCATCLSYLREPNLSALTGSAAIHPACGLQA